MELFVGAFIVLMLGTTHGDEGYFWHITDHHYDTTYWSKMLSCSEPVSNPGMYGDYWCDSPWLLIQESIKTMASIRRNVDFILWTGDNVAHIKDEYINATYNVQVLQKITEELKNRFKGVKVYATMGNHDWYPSDQFPVTSHYIYNATADLWADWIGDQETFRKGAYYTVVTPVGLRIVGLNTNLYYYRDKLTGDMEDPAGQFAWLEQVLQNAVEAKEKVLITAHVPPGVHVPNNNVWMYKHFNSRLLDIIRVYSEIIVGAFMGHTHSDTFQLLQNTGDNPGVPMYMAPSITPWRYKGETFTTDPHNPAIRLIKYDRSTLMPLDYYQYYLDLPESNKVNETRWKMAYQASQVYGMEDLSAVSLNNLIRTMETDQSLLETYLNYSTVLATDHICDRICRANYICSFKYNNIQAFGICVDLFVGGSGHLAVSPLALALIAIIYMFS